jgi:hypothetical protein
MQTLFTLLLVQVLIIHRGTNHMLIPFMLLLVLIIQVGTNHMLILFMLQSALVPGMEVLTSLLITGFMTQDGLLIVIGPI